MVNDILNNKNLYQTFVRTIFLGSRLGAQTRSFSGIVGGYELRRMRSHCVRTSCDFLYGHLQYNTVQYNTYTCSRIHVHSRLLVDRPGKAVRRMSYGMRRSYGNRAMPIQLPCSLRKFCTDIVRPRSEAARRWYGDCTRAVQLSREPSINVQCFFFLVFFA